MARNHVVFAVLALLAFVAHIVANLFVDHMYWLPEYIWGASVALATLAIYAGADRAFGNGALDRGRAIASMIVGALILLGLMYSGITWLFIGADMAGVQM